MISEFAKEKVFWTSRMNLKLVKFIQSRPNIWNPKHPKYTSVEFRDQTYAEFALKYGNEFSGQAVKQRWTNIRSTFANYLRKLNASRAKTEVEEYQVNWQLWEPCQFLLKVNKKVKAEIPTAQLGARLVFEENENNIKDELLSDKEQDGSSEDNAFQEVDAVDSPNLACSDIANSLLTIFKGVQNDTFGLDNTKHGRIGCIVAKRLSHMNSYDAANASVKIMEILLRYSENSQDT